MTMKQDAQGSRAQELNVLLHELNQPLTAISNYAQAGSAMLAGGYPDREMLRELFDKIASQSARTFEISRKLRHHARLPSQDDAADGT